MRVASFFAELGESARVRFEAYDGSSAGPVDAPTTIRLVSPRLFGHLLRCPTRFGLSRAYVLGDIDVDGDLYECLRSMTDAFDDGVPEMVSVPAVLGLIAAIGGRRVTEARPPELEIPGHLPGRKHTRRRDAAAIGHHYDVSNRFYELLLGPSMAYTCAVFPSENASLEEAQTEKLDLVCRKLQLEPGMRLLDVGCGWGSLVMHAAEHHGVDATGVTLSRQQADWAGKAIAEAGLASSARVHLLDYRDSPGDGYDAVSSIGLTEHIGIAQYANYFDTLFAKLRPGGRLLNHCIMRRDDLHRPGSQRFMTRYVFPDSEFASLGRVVSEMQDAGFEPRHSENLREHYALTLAAWSRNLEAHWDEVAEEVGERKARIWRLYMAGARLGFDHNSFQLHQVLAVVPDAGGNASFPLRPDW